MRTPWTHFGQLTNIEMIIWIAAFLLLGGLLMLAMGTVAEKIGDRIRKLIKDYKEAPPRHWRHLESDRIH